VFQYALDYTGIVDDGNHPYRLPALRTFERTYSYDATKKKYILLGENLMAADTIKFRKDIQSKRLE